ncbi:hypothetical protein [Ferrimicrobium acidiphilum]|uniref:hypothetical protein n=1 Tax=Ferrimicrobium acidiphilum TaxID=121039 RepID=UPI0023EF7E46|nr:hypothetical protein [Ferrimicrobium acidiphilum]MCL5052620.1 hypothetical protein [Gammaproteobacteria bacterium]
MSSLISRSSPLDFGVSGGYLAVSLVSIGGSTLAVLDDLSSLGYFGRQRIALAS